MNKESSKKIIVAVLAFFLVLSVGYALLSDTLSINGTAKASGSFDLEFTSVESIEKYGYTDVDNIGDAKIAEITNNKNNLNINVNKLDYPGAYVEIKVKISNVGTVEGKLENINETWNEKSDVIIVSYEGINKTGEVFAAGASKTMTIKIMWDKNDTNSSSVNNNNTNFTLSMNFKQLIKSDSGSGGGIEQTPETCTAFEKKSAYNVGDVIALCNKKTGVSEDFYVVKDNGDTVTMFSKYNLLVGNTANVTWMNDGDLDEITSIIPISSSEKDYGLQSNKAKGAMWDSNVTEFVGVIPFDNIDENHKDSFGDYLGYWVDTDAKLLPAYGNNDDFYGDTFKDVNVYSGNTLIKGHVNNYVSYLNSIGYNNLSGRLLTLNDAFALGCSDDSCLNAPSWLYSTSYWTSSAVEKGTAIFSLLIGGNISTLDYVNNSFMGIRPVITINKSDI